MFSHFNDAVKTGTAPPTALTDGVTLAFWLVAAVSAVAVVASLAFVRSDEIPVGAEAAAAGVA